MSSDTMSGLSLSSLKKVLTELGLSTSTGNARGDERLAILQQRLSKAHEKVLHVQPSKPYNFDQVAISHLTSLSLSELRKYLETKQIDTDTPNLKGKNRRWELLRRLFRTSDMDDNEFHKVCAAASRNENYKMCCSRESPTKTIYLANSSNPGSSTSPKDQGVKEEGRSIIKTEIKTIPICRSSPKNSEIFRTMCLELVQLHKDLHEVRMRRQKKAEIQIERAGFASNLNDLSKEIELLAIERNKIFNLFHPNDLVCSHILSKSNNPVELVQEDAVLLIDKKIHHLKKISQGIQEAIKVIVQHQDSQDKELEGRWYDAKLLIKIKQIEDKLAGQKTDGTNPLDSNLISSRSQVPSNHNSALIPHTFHKLLRAKTEPLITQHDNRAHILKNRILIKSGSSSDFTQSIIDNQTNKRIVNSSNNNASYSLEEADKLGIKAVYLESSGRRNVEVSLAYQQAISIHPEHAVNLGNYAQFLYTKCKLYDKAEIYFQLSLKIDKTMSVNLGNYANFLKRVRRDTTAAGRFYRQALTLEPRNPHFLGNYAHCLMVGASPDNHIKQRTFLEATSLLGLAIDIEPDNIRNLSRMATALAALKQMDIANDVYQKLINLIQSNSYKSNHCIEEPKSARIDDSEQNIAHIYGNYANFLSHQPAKWRLAKEMYLMALNLQPQEQLILRNLYVKKIKS